MTHKCLAKGCNCSTYKPNLWKFRICAQCMHPVDQHQNHEEIEKQIQFQKTEQANLTKGTRPTISPSISQRLISTTPKAPASSRRSQTLNTSAVKEALTTLQELENKERERSSTTPPPVSPVVTKKPKEEPKPQVVSSPNNNSPTQRPSARNIIQRIQSIQLNNGNKDQNTKSQTVEQSETEQKKDTRVRFGEVTTVPDTDSSRSSSDYSNRSSAEFSQSDFGSSSGFSSSNYSSSEFFLSKTDTTPSHSPKQNGKEASKYSILSDDEESDAYESNPGSTTSSPHRASIDEVVTGKTTASKKAIRLQDAMAVGKTRKRLSRSMHTLTWFLGEIDFDKFMLHKAAREGDIQKMKQHIDPLGSEDLKFFLDLQNNTNLWTPLHVAIEAGKTEAARYLIETGASIELKDKIERTPFLYACRYGNYEICKVLLEKGADINAFDCYGETALHLASANPCENSIVIIDLLLNAGLDINCKNTFRETCLHKAARAGSLRLAQYLLRKGATVVTALQGKPKDVVPAENHELYQLLEEEERKEMEKRSSLRSTRSQSHSGQSVAVSIATQTQQQAVVASSSPVTLSPLTPQTSSASTSSDSEIEDDSEVSDEEVIKKPSWDGELLDTPAFTDILKDYKSVIQTLDNSDIKVIEPTENPLEFELDVLYEPYREDFFRTRHFIFACREIFPDETADIKKVLNAYCSANQIQTSCIFVVKRFSATGIYKALAISKWGFTALDVHQKDLDLLIPQSPATQRSKDKDDHQRGLDTNGEVFRVWLEKSCYSSFFQTMVTPPLDFRTNRIRATSISDLNANERNQQEKRRGTVSGTLMQKKGGPKFGWYQLTDKSINVDVLGLEAELAPSRCYCIAVVYSRAGQTNEQDMYRNECTTNFERFLDILGDKIELRGWSGFKGGFDTTSKTDAVTYYTSWRGFEIMYHVVPFLQQDQVRRLVGNDKAIIYFQEETAFVPNFRSDVNSVGIVVQPCVSGGNSAYLVGSFTRPNVKTFHPSLPSAPVTNRKKLKDLLISTAISGIEATNKSPPFVFLYANRWKEALDGLINKHPKSKSKKKL